MRPLDRLKNRLQFHVEWLLLRGPIHRVFVIACVIGFVSLSAGFFVLVTTSGFNSPGAAIWWAFLRLTDPGYLGDDQGTLLRVVSTIVTILGYVLFMGSLIAIMTQWLNATIGRLEKGLTPIARRNHIIVLGWGLRSAEVVRDLLSSEGRVRRFLDRRGGGRLHVVILAEDVDHSLVQELKDRLGSLWNPRRITIRSGSPLHLEHLRRVDFLNASAILLPGREIVEEGEASQDAIALKTLLSTASASRKLEARLPLMVAEVSDARIAPMATSAYGGPIEVISSERIVARLIVQTIRNPGLPAVYTELLDQRGSGLYVRDFPEIVGQKVSAIRGAFDRAIFVGVVRESEGSLTTFLSPPAEFVIEPEDRVVVMAEDYESTRLRKLGESQSHSGKESAKDLVPKAPRSGKILLVGWNQTAPEVIRELGHHEKEGYQIDSMTVVSRETRQRSLRRQGVDGDPVELTLLEGDATSPSELAQVDLEGYEQIILLAADRFESEVDSDARTAMSSLMIESALTQVERRPRVLIELNDSGNVSLFRQRGTEVIVSPLLLGHMLSHVALRRELRAVYDELLGAEGAEIVFSELSGIGLEPGNTTFAEMQSACWRAQATALGFIAKGEVVLNPEPRKSYLLAEQDFVITLVISR